MSVQKPWQGRFTQGTDTLVEQFTASINVDCRLYHHDIAGSMAHARMLAKVGAISVPERDQILSGLAQIEAEIAAGRFVWKQELEDVHMNIEADLIARVGEPGKKLHTGRSRNDQVVTATRLFTRDAIDGLRATLAAVQNALLDLATVEAATVMPGFTHLQVAQPVTFGHHLLAWFEMLERDDDRLIDCRRRVNVLPLGAAALAGTTYPIDRQYTASLLGFETVCENSLDAVADRDFAVELAAVLAILMSHLSRFCEELILWATTQFGFVDLPDSFCTGSSIMPQKKNPDVLELIRGKTGRAYGDLMALLTLVKSQPLAYNKDNQEDKEPLFDAVDTASSCLQAFGALIPVLRLNRPRLREAAASGFSTATDLADYLAKRGLPFRSAHDTVGQVVRRAIALNKGLMDFTLDELRKFSPLIDQDVFDVLTVDGSVNSRRHFGGTAPDAVREAIRRAHERRTNKGQE
ncbi:MAG: argininosuccinate lyase [Acidiferrobacteraceae bacterium]|jgi:argininosuccinate lyase